MLPPPSLPLHVHVLRKKRKELARSSKPLQPAAPKIMEGVARLKKNIPQETGAVLTQGAPHGSPKNSQVLRHSSSLHCSSSLLAGQDTIPAVDVVSTSLVLNLVPPPQGLSHSLHSLHSPTSHPA